MTAEKETATRAVIYDPPNILSKTLPFLLLLLTF